MSFCHFLQLHYQSVCAVLCTCMRSEEKHIKLKYLLIPNSCWNIMKLHLISMFNLSSCNLRWNNEICLSNFPAAYDNFKLINNNYYRSGITSINSAHPRPPLQASSSTVSIYVFPSFSVCCIWRFHNSFTYKCYVPL